MKNETNRKKKHGGDDGESYLLDGTRLSKNDPVFSALGDIDELSSFLGLAKAFMLREETGREREAGILESIQADLIRIGARLAMPAKDSRSTGSGVITPDDVNRLEEQEALYRKEVGIPKKFILPGSTITGAHVDVSRTVCRRAERRVVACITGKKIKELEECQRYLNRLSGLLFVLARWLEQKQSQEEK